MFPLQFEKPGRRADVCYPDFAREAITKALQDAGIKYEEVQQAVAGYVYGDSTCGQRAIYEVGMTGIPVYNVNNNCSTGSSALYLAKQIVESGNADCVGLHICTQGAYLNIRFPKFFVMAMWSPCGNRYR